MVEVRSNRGIRLAQPRLDASLTDVEDRSEYSVEVEDGQLQRIETIVDQARALSTDQRARFLGEVCDGDAALRDEVETRLARDNPELSADLMESIALEAVAAASISIIARDDARSAPVAISAGEGRPSFVMEAVDGQPIDQYCDSHRLDVPARLKLFSRVCEAVHFAHQHAMIHRDLKPNHILVTADGMPTIAGFGIAKLIDSETHGERILTPEYASPEQIQGEPVTTAGDIYAMGVVLYQLLAGRWPYRLKTQTPTTSCRPPASRRREAQHRGLPRRQARRFGGDRRGAIHDTQPAQADLGRRPRRDRPDGPE